MRRNPVTSGLYEVIVNQIVGNGLEAQEILLLMWNGKLWLTPAGAAVLGKSIKNSSWRGVTRSAYEAACAALGLALTDARDQGQSAVEEAGAPGGDTRDDAGDEIDLFVGLAT